MKKILIIYKDFIKILFKKCFLKDLQKLQIFSTIPTTCNDNKPLLSEQ